MKREEIIKALRVYAREAEYNEEYEPMSEFEDAAAMLESDAAEIAALKAENERTRQESVSMKVYQMMCEERDAAVNDLSLTNTRKFNNPCEICKHNKEKCEPVDLQSVCCKWEWRGLQKEK